MKKILIVDDEVQILNSISRIFSETDYETLTAENGFEALKLIESTDIDMVISDLRMPVLNGYKLLSIVKEKHPKIIRIILSGYAEEKPMFQAILHNIAKLYVFKPWNNDALLTNVEKLFADDTLLSSNSLSSIVKDLEYNLALSECSKKMLELVEAEDIKALIESIEQDDDVATLLMQVVKSAVYGVTPNAIKQAATYIGLDNLKCFLYWSCVASTSKHAEIEEGKPELLWEHAYLTNRIYLFLYESLLHKQPAESTFFAGLMHNIGFIILAKSLQNKGILQNDYLLSVDEYINLENKYEIHHEEIGCYFLDLWDIPFPMYEVALYHHMPLDENIIFYELVCSVHIAQHYAWKALGATQLEPVAKEVFDRIGLSSEDFEKKLLRYMKQ